MSQGLVVKGGVLAVRGREGAVRGRGGAVRGEEEAVRGWGISNEERGEKLEIYFHCCFQVFFRVCLSCCWCLIKLRCVRLSGTVRTSSTTSR